MTKCPRFKFCNANICPLDNESHIRNRLDDELKCGVAKSIGLYVCRGMIEDNGGKVWAESDGEYKGSRFIVELPINPPEEVIKKIEEAKAKQKTT